MSSLSTWKKIRKDILAEIQSYDKKIDKAKESIAKYKRTLKEAAGEPLRVRAITHLMSDEEKYVLQPLKDSKKRAEEALKRAEKTIKDLKG